jgi:site-specific DNA recombinase
MDDDIRVALYARVSSERQADEATIRSQVAALKKRIEADGCKLEPEYCFLDEGYSGGTMRRPALERLRDVAYNGAIDRLYVLAPDRLARKYAYQVVLVEEFAKHQVEIVFLNDVQGLGSAEGDLLLQMQGMIAEYERAKILERTRRGRRHAARQGKVSAMAHAPYGYRYVPKNESGGEARYEVAPEQSERVRAIFTWVAVEGLSLGDVSRRLGEHGVPSPTGLANWDRATVRGILLNPAYQGTARYGKTRLSPRTTDRRAVRGAPLTPRSEKVAQPTPLAEQEEIPVPAIVGVELFQSAAERLEENRRRHREQAKGATFLLSGLLVCARCDSAYCGRRNRAKPSGEYIYYRCIGTDRTRRHGERICSNRGINGQVENVVWSDLCSLLREPERLQQEYQSRLNRPANESPEVERLEQAVAQQKRRIARLIDAYENAWLDKTDFAQRIGAAKDRLAREEAALAHHRREAVDAEDLRLAVGRFHEFAERIQDNLEHADFATKRQLLRLLVKRIEVGDEGIRIVYKVSPRPFPQAPANGGILHHCLKSALTPSA